ncbi:MAG: hypothetical protein B7Z73_03230 [Planctomycetia bacterium 21-64-5]|nr:MAG: hypothetical protein B7Z73_03230 [Planctomycetia bacterium 21-64-5]HQU41268.1 carboxypeptidase-like regulatory domain-containing protein [Pirellulales bacterium]
MKSFFVFAVLCCFVCGCGKSTGPPKALIIPVTGTVTLDGKPLPGADVTFIPSQGIGAFTGRTNDDGSYQLEGLVGAKAKCQGKCGVRISRMLKPDGSLPSPDEPPANVGATESLPERYSSASTTELSAEVPEGGGKFDFPLKSS